MRKIIYIFIAVALLCQCTTRNVSSDSGRNEVDTSRFASQFLSIIKEYVDCHPQFDSYLISSELSIAVGEVEKFDPNKTGGGMLPRKFFITPACECYTVKYSEDSVYTFDCIIKDALSSYFTINGKKVYLCSDIDDLSKSKIQTDSIQHRIESHESGGIWCFTAKDCKYKIITKKVEDHRELWPGFLVRHNAIKFPEPHL